MSAGATADAKPLTSDERLTLRHLVQHVARTFFDVDQVVALDQLAKHDVLKDDDLAGRIGLNPKETAKRIGKLVNSRLVMCHSQNEQRDANTNRSSVRKYYYIDYATFVNLVKWGIAEMRRNIDNKARSELADKGYICLTCKTKYTMFDADRLFDPYRNGFFCENCTSEVTDNRQKMQRFNARTERIVSLLKKTDEIILPKLDIGDWVRRYAEAQHAQALANAAASAEAGLSAGNGMDGSSSKGYGSLKVAGINGTGAPTSSKVSVEIIDMDEKEQLRRKKEKEAEGELRRQQNALPAWYTHSTITGEATAFGIKNDVTTPLTPPLPSAPLPGAASAPLPPSLSALGGLDALVTMDDDDDFGAGDDDDEVKPSLIPEINAKTAEMTPEARADYYSRYYANIEAQKSESSSLAGPSGLKSSSQKAHSSAASSPAPGSISSPLPAQALIGDESDSNSNSDTGRLLPGGLGRKRPREDDDFADPDEGEDPSIPVLSRSGVGVGSGKSGILVQVNGSPMDFSDVTDDHHELMTPEEYEAYFEVASSIG